VSHGVFYLGIPNETVKRRPIRRDEQDGGEKASLATSGQTHTEQNQNRERGTQLDIEGDSPYIPRI
jgi:hypothetical protein